MKYNFFATKNNILFLVAFFLISSCSQEKLPEQKSSPVSSFSKLEISGLANNNATFTLKAQKAIANNTNTIFQLENINFSITKNNKIIYSINSQKGLYDKEKSSFNLTSALGFTKDKNISIKSDNLTFSKKSNYIYGKNAIINFSDNQIDGKDLKLDSELKHFSMEKVKAKFHY